MVGTLAEQLAKNAFLNAALYVDRSRRKPPASYLWTGRDADKYDLETIHALGVNAFIHLANVCPALEAYEEPLFSERAKATDRTLLSPDAIEELDKSISGALALLGPYLMDAPTGKALEWLVRRFRIHEYNIDALMTLFLPYHETPHFTKMISILELKPNTRWGFLIPYKTAAQNVPRVSLVSEMLRNGDVARFVAALLPDAVKEGRVHRTLLAFNAATIHEFIKRSKSLDEGTVAFLLPSLLEPLQLKSEHPSKDTILGSYILLATLSQKCDLASPALKVILSTMAATAHSVPTKNFVSAAVAVCQPQTELEKLSDSTATQILRLKGINEEVTAACKWHGSEKLLLPLITRCCSKLSDPDVTEFLEDLVATSAVPEAALVRLATLLIKKATAAESSLSERRLLGIVQQRHPAVVQHVTKEIIEEDEDLKDAIEQLVLSLSIDIPTTQVTANLDIVVASTHADSNVRAIAVKKLMASGLPDEEMQSIRSALLARLFDHDVEVLEALYDNPKALVQALSSNASEYVDALSKAIASPGAKPKRAVLRLHLAFLTDHALATLNAAEQEDCFQRIFFPFLLFSKPRQHTAEMVWDSIAEKYSKTFELIKGVADLWLEQKSSERSIDTMVTLNNVIASKIASNIIKSDNFSKQVENILSKLKDENPWTRSLALLIVRFLVEQLSDSHQLQVGKAVLESLNLESLPSVEDLAEGQSFEEAVNSDTVGKLVVAKPQSKTTQGWLQISVIASVARISKAVKKSIDWFKNVDKTSEEAYECYMATVRRIYKLSSSSGSVPGLAMGLLQVLFAGLGDDALVFLAGIWTTKEEGLVPLQPLALLHATAFLEAHAQEQDGTDFQTILPAILVGLQSTNSQCRSAVLECISRLLIIANGKLTQVYKFDIVYGPKNQTLQYLDQDDLKQYLTALLEHRDHFVNDSGYLGLFHGQYLVKNSGDRKRESEYRKRVLSYLLSHINALSSQDVQTALLWTLRQVKDKARPQILLPSIQALFQSPGSFNKDLTSALVAAFDSSSARDLNDAEKPFWKVYLNLLRHYLPAGSAETPGQVLKENLQQGLFQKLDQNRKIELCGALLDICEEHPESHVVCKEILAGVLQDIPVMVTLLNSLAPINKASDRAVKRAKTAETEQLTIVRLTYFAEVLNTRGLPLNTRGLPLNTRGLPGSTDLISHLLQTLSAVVQSMSSTQADVNYTEQLLMSAIDSVAAQVTERPNLSPSAIRLDVLVELIRVTDNPQTFHQALILMSNLTRLAPDSVLHNIMPVFTFMGSNVFHRDDASSFNVVQKTIDGIVPVMVSALKKSSSDPLQLAIGAKEFLHIFTDAANHIPRHRRTKFFSHLVTVLGPDDFLAPVCILLVEKMANKLIRQTEEEARAALSLPVALLNNSSLATRIQAIVSILDEVDRLCARATSPDQQIPTFLSVSSSEQASPAVICRRRAQALIVLTGCSFNAPLSNIGEAPLNLVVKKLISLSTAKTADGGEKLLQDISTASQRSLNQILSVMPANAFLTAIASIVETDDSKIHEASLDILSQRVQNISAKTRQDTASTIAQIISSLKRIISKESDASLLSSALHALQLLAATMESQEHGPIAELVPLVLKATSKAEVAEDAWQSLLPMSRNLGPRIIPHFRSIVQESIVALSADSPSTAVIHSTLQGLLTSIPTFWAAPEILSLLNLYIDQAAGSTNSSMLGLIKALTKKVSSKILLATLLEMWPPVQNPLNLDRVAAYFELVFRTLHNADRASVLEHIRATFKVFLEGLAFVVPGHKLEANVISAFRELVVKLNETAFRPLFRRLYDWAFATETAQPARKVVFIHLYLGLQDFFKGLMGPYMSFLLKPYEDILKGYSKFNEGDQQLWTATITSLHRSLIHDERGFWRNDKLRQISSTLTDQLTVAVKFNVPEEDDVLRDCLIALVEASSDDVLLKAINLNILMHTRSEEARLRIYALTSSQALWRANGHKLIGFVAETATFIAECSEDENDVVVKESLRLKNAVESVAGKIDEL
ncbi:hypothetical protein FA15DRAFT_669091 [Coprinopsis marcescibilis]|uniref:U3 small nucleolar RNA-associated protein 10 n=1 Tax=Coprinopsis marcescibilis TaxID=230819 RepID=A0A5C3KWI3_COPMA|nr:hypothetical protein FA15DRAFT_669091 [Coprinopsis marcescibilis]